MFIDLLTRLFPMHPFLYPLKISENRKVFWCFQGVEKGCIGKKWVNSKFWGQWKKYFTWVSTNDVYLTRYFMLQRSSWRKNQNRYLTTISFTDIFYTSIKRKDFRANSATAGKYWIRVRGRFQISLLILCEFKRLVNFYSPENHPKTIGFLMISGG